MRRDDFAAAFAGMKNLRIDALSEIQEIQVAGDWAYCRNHLHVTATPLAGGESLRRAGYTLTIFRKRNGAWVIARDANLLGRPV
jgi:uncharacterized protein (TIGR02246 family)